MDADSGAQDGADTSGEATVVADPAQADPAQTLFFPAPRHSKAAAAAAAANAPPADAQPPQATAAAESSAADPEAAASATATSGDPEEVDPVRERANSGAAQMREKMAQRRSQFEESVASAPAEEAAATEGSSKERCATYDFGDVGDSSEGERPRTPSVKDEAPEATPEAVAVDSDKESKKSAEGSAASDESRWKPIKTMGGGERPQEEVFKGASPELRKALKRTHSKESKDIPT